MLTAFYTYGGFLFMMSFLSALPGAAAQGIIWGIMAIGVYITFRVLDIADLTVDGSFGTGGAVLVMCTISGMNIYLAMVLAFLAGCLAGLATGIFHTVLGIPAILSGILTQLALYSINLRILGGKANQTISARNYNLIVSLGEINKSLIVGLAFAVVIIAILYWFFGTELGHSIRATGNNQAMARANGINTNVNKIIGLVLSNGLVAVSGALLSQYIKALRMLIWAGAQLLSALLPLSSARFCLAKFSRTLHSDFLPALSAELFTTLLLLLCFASALMQTILNCSRLLLLQFSSVFRIGKTRLPQRM